MKQRKAQIIKARISTNMKRSVHELANQRGESEAVIVREALSQYLTSKRKCNGQDRSSAISYRRKKRAQQNKELKREL